MLVVLLPEDLSKEIPDMSKDDQDEVRDICRKKVIVGRLILNRILDRLARGVYRDITMTRMADRRELRMVPLNLPRLIRGWG